MRTRSVWQENYPDRITIPTPAPQKVRLRSLILTDRVVHRAVTASQTHSSYIRDLKRQGVTAFGVTRWVDGVKYIFLWGEQIDAQVRKTLE